jgi:hypothetical protein
MIGRNPWNRVPLWTEAIGLALLHFALTGIAAAD